MARASLLVLIILFTFFMNLQARNLHGYQFIRENNANSHRFLHKFGFDLSKHIHVHDADDVHKDRNTRRLAPEGPDPHHNATPPRI